MTAHATESQKPAYAPPPVNGDFYRMLHLLGEDERTIVRRVRDFMESEIAPIIEDYWARDAFPFEIVPKLRALDIAGIGYRGYGSAGGSWLLNAVLCMEIARVDASIATFWGVHTGLSAGSIYLCGDEEQKQRWLPAMMRWEKIGSFCLTEPDVGSATSGGMKTTCRRDGDGWVLNGQKKWIGNAPFADLNVIWAREETSGQVKGFVVLKDNPGFSVEKIHNKMALRVVQNGLITLADCRVPEADRLQNANSFKDTAKVLRMTRAGVAGFAVGCGMGAYEHALRYAQTRTQFGRPIGGFQLVQDLLVRMLGNVTATQMMLLRLGQLQDEGAMLDEHASLAKAYCTVKCRETVGYARELLGGNGILLDNHIGRFVADAEAIYSYEGTREMNTLIVGKAITGLSAFV
ncbi:acyl-CoA dehydrogenase family protein [Phreatobacter sp. AB_2022a]|uniref:acyl-CoA dehydrogenase family protein n=1 Tax=Phreatobacter sp. AB_2022a TaxID=3003134 RepID=UPI0022876B81|nr:acyl-CoA dehydrogenase family protein [Phreatobacter sp. AB_2022a]MCZ0735302.1 acyl-CoA dehydrogenase family protein [Phreatobacter sp. AB_2022a]